MSRSALAAGLAIVALVAGAAIWFASSGPTNAPKDGRPDTLPPLGGELGDRVTARIVGLLQACQAQLATPTCERTMGLQFRLVVRAGRGQVESLNFDSRGLDPQLDSCFRAAIERFRFEAAGADGQLDVSFPVLCDPDRRIRLLRPAPANAQGPRLSRSAAPDGGPEKDQTQR